jgi:iron complex outermembrane receptor protein
VGIADAQSLAARVPGLLFNRQANASIPFLRGVGTPVGESGDEPSVALYVDDVYLPAGSASMANFTSIDRIEVEKGPQGTLFGRNATGGVVQVFTRSPTDTPEFQVGAGYANYDDWSADIYASGPLTDRLLANVAAYWSDQSEGWGRNVTTGVPAFRSRDYGARIKLLWNETDRTSVLLNLDFDETATQQGLGFRAFPGTGSLNPLPPFPNGGFTPAPGYYDPNEDFDSEGSDRQYGASLKITHDFDRSRLVSISAYRDTRAEYLLDEDSGPLAIVHVQIATPETTFTQELRLISEPGSGVSWIAGFFYFDDEAGFDPIVFTGLGFAPLPFVNSYGILTTESYALFAQATKAISSNTRLTAGARYTWDDRTLHASAVFGGGAPVPAPNSPQSKSWSSPNWRLALDHQFTPDIMAYLGYSRGFKSGLFNPVVLPGAPIDESIDPEALDAYTVGLKSEYLQHRLRVNIEGFYYDFKNIQVEQILSAVSHITNAAKAKIKGVDVDISAVPVDRLTLTASLEVMEGRYQSFPDGTFFVYDPVAGGNCTFAVAPPPAPVPCGGGVTPPNYDAATGNWDLKGNHTIQTPPFSLSLMGQYEIPTSSGHFDLNVSWTRTGNYYASADNGKGQIPPSSQQNDKQETIDVINGSLGWTSSDLGLAVRLWGKNLTDVQYWSYADEISFATFYSPAAPRTYGISVTKRFE